MLLGKRKYTYSDKAQELLDTLINDLNKQALEANTSRLTSFFAKQASQITRITALTQIIDLIPLVIQNVNV